MKIHAQPVQKWFNQFVPREATERGDSACGATSLDRQSHSAKSFNSPNGEEAQKIMDVVLQPEERSGVGFLVAEETVSFSTRLWLGSADR